MDDHDAGRPLAARMAARASALRFEDLPPEVADKARLCLLDLFCAALESRDLPWSREAVGLACDSAPGGVGRGAGIIGTPHVVAPADAAFANGVLGHGLVREDMHAGAVSHLGVAVLPALLALAAHRGAPGRDFLAAVAVGYEVGGRLGRALLDRDRTRFVRPTGVTGPVAAAAAAARLLRLSPDAATSAIALAANMTGGLNEWAHTGGSDMFFHPGQAARSGVTAARLAELGAFGSPTALDGPAGLFASFGREPAASVADLFSGGAEIAEVYFKAAPVCNFAQTACQAALAVAADPAFDRDAVARIEVHLPAAAAAYPGCASTGPFTRVLQAKMSIPFNVAAALYAGVAAESNFDLLDDPALRRLTAAVDLRVDPAMTAAFPARQPAEVVVRTSGGARLSVRLEDVVAATPDEVRRRFRAVAGAVLGAQRTAAIEAAVDGLEDELDAGRLGPLLALPVAA